MQFGSKFSLSRVFSCVAACLNSKRSETVGFWEAGLIWGMCLVL